MTRLNQVLVAALALQVVLLGVRWWSAGVDPVETGREPLIEGIDLEDVRTLQVGDAEQQVTVERGSDGWSVAEAFDYPADDDKVESALRELLTLEVADRISETDRHHRDLEVSEATHKRRVSLKTDDGETVVYLGTSGRGGSLHARRAGQDEVVAVRDYSVWKLGSDDSAWVDRVVFEVPKDGVGRVLLERPDERIELLRDGDDWTASRNGGAPLLAARSEVDKVLGDLTRVSLKEVVGPAGADGAAGLDWRVEVGLLAEGDDDSAGVGDSIGETRVLHLGQGEGEDWLAWVEGSAHRVVLSRWAVDALSDLEWTALTEAP